MRITSIGFLTGGAGMQFIGMLIIGLIAGAIAKFLMPGRDPGGCLVTMALGVAGAFVAGLIGRQIGMYQNYGEAPGLIGSVIGAVLILFIYRLIVGRRRGT